MKNQLKMAYFSNYKNNKLDIVSPENSHFCIVDIHQLLGENYIIEKLLNFKGQKTTHNILFNVDLMNSVSKFNLTATKMFLRGKIKPERLFHIACIEMRLKGLKYFEQNQTLDFICGNAMILSDEEIIRL